MTTTGRSCPPIPRRATWLLKFVTVLLVFGLGSIAMAQTTHPTAAFDTCYDLETGEAASEGAPSQCQPHGDITWAYKADTTVHARLSWNAEYVDVAFVAKAYDDVTDADISQSYFCESVDDDNAGCQDADPHSALGDERSAILLTGDGNYFKVGFISESDNDVVVFEYELLISGPARDFHSGGDGMGDPSGDPSGDYDYTGDPSGDGMGDPSGDYDYTGDPSGDDPGDDPLEINCPPDASISCEDSLETVADLAAAVGGCPGTLDITHVDGGAGPVVCDMLLRTWTATDSCGNTASCEQIVTITDDQAPVITCPEDVTVSCEDDRASTNTGVATATDNCDDGELDIAEIDSFVPGSCPQAEVITRIWTATDSCGNASSCDQTVTVVDDQAPDITCPDDVTIELNTSSDPDSTGYASVSDNCDNNPMVTWHDTTDPYEMDDEYPTIFRSWTGTDECGNTTVCDQEITWIDKPYLSYWWPANGATEVHPETRLEFVVDSVPTAMQIIPGYDDPIDGGGGREEEFEDEVTYDLFVGQGTVTIEEFLDGLNNLHAQNSDDIQFRANGNVVFQDGGSAILLFDMEQNNSVTVTGIEEELFDNGITFNPTGEPVYDAAQARKNFPILGVTWYGALYYCNWLTLLKEGGEEKNAYVTGPEPADWRPASLSTADWQDGFSDSEREAWMLQYPVAYRLPMDDYAGTASRYNEFFHFASRTPSFLTEEGSHSFNYWNSGDFFDNGPVPPDYYDFLAQLLRAVGGDSSLLVLQNVLGNVWEWQTDTFASQDLSARSIRGASWYSNQELLDPATRFAADPGSGFADVGFRVVSSRGAVFEVEIAENAEFTDSTVLTMSSEFPDLNGYYANRTWELSLAPSTDYFWRVRGFYSSAGEPVPVDLPFGAPWDSPSTPYATFRTSHQVREPTLQLNLAEEWNLVSVNVDPDIAHPKHLFGADSTAWGWDSEQQIYFRLYEIEPFEGFWIHVPEPETVDVAGFTPEPEIEIRDGWNLLGPLNDGTPIPSASKLRGEVLQYLNGDYEFADVLDTGIGYWLFFVSNFVHDLSGDGEEDYDTAGFTVTESAGSTVVAENGGTDTFDVVLNAQPGSEVILTVTSNSTADATVNLASLVFTPVDWDVAQTVTVTGVDDYEAGEDVTTVTLAVADGSSESWADQDVVVTCTDDGNDFGD